MTKGVLAATDVGVSVVEKEMSLSAGEDDEAGRGSSVAMVESERV